MYHFHAEVVRPLLRSLQVGDPAEGMVQPPILHFALAQLPGQITVAIAADLEPEGTPGRHPHLTQSQIRVDEIDIIVQALAIIRLPVGGVGLLVMPRLVAAAGLHGRQDPHDSGLFPSLVQHWSDLLLWTELLVAAKEHDLRPVSGRAPLQVLSDDIAPWLCPLGVVENADLVLVNVVRDAFGITPLRQRALDDDPVISRRERQRSGPGTALSTMARPLGRPIYSWARGSRQAGVSTTLAPWGSRRACLMRA